MFKTIFKAILYLIFIGFILVLSVVWVNDIIIYITTDSTVIPLSIKIVEGILTFPILGPIIESIINVIR